MSKGNVTVPPPPPPSAAETELMKKQSGAIDYYLESLKKQDTQNADMQSLLKVGSGLYTPTFDEKGNITGTTLDMNALNTIAEERKRNQGIADLEFERYQKALKGELPISEATKQAEEQQFSLLKEGLSMKGSDLTGTTLDNAVATDSAGVENLSRLRKEFALIKDSERRGELDSARGLRLGTDYLSPVATATSNYGPGSTGAGYGQVGSLYGQSLQPFQYQRGLEFQSKLGTAQNKMQREAGIYNMIGTAAGSGAALGSAAIIASSRTFKKDIKEMDESEEDNAMEVLHRGKLYRYKYKDEDDDSKGHMGFVTEEAPSDIVTEDGKHLDTVSYFGLLTSAVRSLNRKLERLESEEA